MAIIKVKTGGITADAITDALIADDVVGTEHLTANEVDTTALGADAVTGAQLADNAVNSEHYTDGSVDTAHIADVNVTQGKIADQAINEAKMQISNSPTNGYALTAQSGNTGGLTWAEIGGGKVIQYKHDYDSASIGLSNTSWTDTNLSIAFTPTSASNRIVLKGFVQVYVNGEPSYHGNMEYKVLNGSSVIMETYSAYCGYGGNEALFNGMLPFNVYETTAGNTNERTYKVQVRNSDTNSGAHYNQYSGYSALEIWEIDY